MIRLSCTQLSLIKHRTLLINGYYLQTTSSRKLITDISNSSSSQSITVSYLQNSCGLSSKSAISVSKRFRLDNTENPDLVLNLLRNHGLAQTHLKNLIINRPVLLLADLENTLKPNLELFSSLGFSSTSLAKLLNKEPRVLEIDVKTVVEFFRENGFSENQIMTMAMKRPNLYLFPAHKTLKPKLEFLKSLGFSDPELARILSSQPTILQTSLENQIMPCIQVLRRVIGKDENIIKAIRAHPRILGYNLVKVLEPNISLLENHGVPEHLILKIFLFHSRSLLLRTSRFKEIISEVEKLGFNPTTLAFLLAIHAMAGMKKKVWEQKLEAYGSFGLSKDEVYLAFKLQPLCMLTSEKKIRKLMGFFLNKLNMKPSTICKYPSILLLSLEKRIIPRCSVLQILMSKELIRKDIRLFPVFQIKETIFVEKFVSKYQDMVPEVIEAHQGKIEFLGFPKELKI